MYRVYIHVQRDLNSLKLRSIMERSLISVKRVTECFFVVKWKVTSKWDRRMAKKNDGTVVKNRKRSSLSVGQFDRNDDWTFQIIRRNAMEWKLKKERPLAERGTARKITRHGGTVCRTRKSINSPTSPVESRLERFLIQRRTIGFSWKLPLLPRWDPPANSLTRKSTADSRSFARPSGREGVGREGKNDRWETSICNNATDDKTAIV